MKTHVHKNDTEKFMEALFIIPPQTGSNKDILQYMNGQTNCGISIQWDVIWHQKEMTYQTMIRNEGDLKTYY